jgi:hypothetical protein
VIRKYEIDPSGRIGSRGLPFCKYKGEGLLEVDRSSLEWVRANVIPLGEPDGEWIDAVLK